MNVPRYSAAAARLLARHVPEDAAPAGERERGIETIERALWTRTKRRRQRLALAAVLAAASFGLIWRFAAMTHGEAATSSSISVSPLGLGATLRAPGGARALGGSADLQPDQAIETPDGGGASLKFSTGTRIELEGASRFGVETGELSGHFLLARGQLSTHVQKLRPGERFVIRTPDAEVEVRGTTFRLAVLGRAETCGNGSRTRLEVSEGVVEVRSAARTARVSAGESWPFDCPARAAATPASAGPEAKGAAPETTGALRAGSGASPPHAEQLAHAVAPSSTAPPPHRPTALARQNDLFAEAVAARQRGDVAGALRAYQELLKRFPESPLVENALAERMRLLLPGDAASAREEARRYLLRYPRGFAAEEASRVLEQR
jgi:ferric-dicitrate binding protein FerR (iron transport regulator)